jgi:hypothetical protein
MKYLLIAFALVVSSIVFAQSEGDVIINEIANNGSKKAMYTGGEYVELLVIKKEGVKLAGWSLTDLGSPSGTTKENEGSIKFSDKDGSVFQNTIPQGTYILICLGKNDEKYGSSTQKEDVSLSDGNNRVVVFAYDSPQHIERGEGTMQFTGKDNLALVSSWKKDAAVSVVTWGSPSSWTGCKAIELTQDALDNGKIAYFVPKGSSASDFTKSDPAAWESTADARKATPAEKNKGVDDEALQKK